MANPVVEFEVSLRHQDAEEWKNRGLKQCGDICCAFPVGTPRGKEEGKTKLYVECELDVDQWIAERLDAIAKTGEKSVHVVWPYASYEKRTPTPTDPRPPQMLSRSTKKVPLARFAGSAGMDPATYVKGCSAPTDGKPRLKASELVEDKRDRVVITELGVAIEV